MKRILLATGLGLGILTFTMAGTTNFTAPMGPMTNDTVPGDTTEPTTPTPDEPTTPVPDTANFIINR